MNIEKGKKVENNMSVKIDRLNNSFIKIISEIIYNDVKDSDIKFVTITDCKITNDLSYAKVYFTSICNDIDKVTCALNKASSFIRGKLASKIEIRKIPELSFVYDESIEYGKKIENIIDRINNGE